MLFREKRTATLARSGRKAYLCKEYNNIYIKDIWATLQYGRRKATTRQSSKQTGKRKNKARKTCRILF